MSLPDLTNGQTDFAFQMQSLSRSLIPNFQRYSFDNLHKIKHMKYLTILHTASGAKCIEMMQAIKKKILISGKMQ